MSASGMSHRAMTFQSRTSVCFASGAPTGCPPGLGPGDMPRPAGAAAEVPAAEQVGEHGDQEPEPDHPREEDEHGSKDAEEWIVGNEQAVTSC